MNCDTIDKRRALLESLGGLPETTVRNTEWLYMLEEDTRQSLAIEGHFASEEDLEAVLRGRKADLDISNYFRIAQTAYDLALQYYRDRTTARLDLAHVRHIHSELFRRLDDRRGAFRLGPIRIHGAKVTPPEFEIPAYVQAALQVTQDVLASMPILPALARAHTLFESIHPFPDGNGRTGRILLNYLAISEGYPPIVIKGIDPGERKRYYQALEAADRGFHRGFPDPTASALRERVEEGDFEPLAQILCEGLLPRLETMIVLAMEKQEPLLDLPEVAARLRIKEDALRQRIQRGKHLAIKRGKRLYTHPRLAL
jgi:Fic family protein